MRAREHLDDLTPREREVLDLLRLGLTNEEIADRLGISLDGAKYHVSQILSKLGVERREEAAAIPLAKPRPWWAIFPLAAKAAGVAVALAAVGGLGLLGWSVLTMSDGTEADTSVPSTVDGPRIGNHWHAPIFITVCGEEQRDVSVPESGVRTQGDSIIHIQPGQPFEEGLGSRLVKWFEYGGGVLTETEINIPGSDKTFRNGDLCPDGESGEVQVFVTRAGESAEERRAGDYLQQYIPHDGDRITIAFRSEDEPMIFSNRTVIAEEQATHTVEIAVTDDGTEESTRFEPDRIEVTAGETVKIVVMNQGQIPHGLYVAGDDADYGSSDDFVSIPDIIQPGQEGFVIVRLNTLGEAEFRDDNPLAAVVTGVIVVTP